MPQVGRLPMSSPLKYSTISVSPGLWPKSITRWHVLGNWFKVANKVGMVEWYSASIPSTSLSGIPSSFAKISAVVSALFAVLLTNRSTGSPRSWNTLAMNGALRSPRSFKGRSKSREFGSDQLLLACLVM